MLQVLCAKHKQPVQLVAHPDLHVGHVIVYVTSPNLSNIVAEHNLPCWWPSHY